MYPMKSKDEVLEKLKLYLAVMSKPLTLISEGALEFKSRGSSDLWRKNGIPPKFTPPYIPQENGKI